MAFKLPALNFPSGGNKGAKSPLGPITVIGSPATIDPNTTIVARVVSRASTYRLPLIGHLPIDRQIRMLGTTLLASLVLGFLVVAFDMTTANRITKNIEVAGDSLMHSQRLARSAPNALAGNPTAFGQLKDSHARLNENLQALVESTGSGVVPMLSKVQERWAATDKAATAISGDEKVLLSLGATLSKLNAVNPTLLDLTEQIAALKLQGGANAREIAASSQLVMLTQRIAKGANELLSGTGVNPEVAFLLGKDTNTFRDVLTGLLQGSDTLRLGATNDPETRAKLNELKTVFTEFQGAIGSLLGSLQKIVAAKQAEQRIFAESEGLKEDLVALRDAYVGEQSGRWFHFGVLALLALLMLLSSAGIAKLFLDDSRRRALEAERERETAERQEQEMKRMNDQNQAAILRLMNELQEVADGDLTVQATVSEDITGAIADSVNYTVEELRSLVGRINKTAEQVAGASSQAADRSQQLLAASEAQSREIRETGESVLRMAQQISDVSVSAAESAKVARQSLDAAQDGQRAVQNAISGMNEIREQIQETSKRIKRLGESSQEIGEIIELITDITEQTNVLALNAAIQAASAGEAGRGFSVVAEEVQRLAERSQEAAKQIGALIRTIQTDTQDAVAAMEKSTQGVVEGARLSDEAGRALIGIGQVSSQLAELIEDISSSTSEQAQSAGGVARSIERILEVNEQTSAGTEQTAQSIRELSGLATELKNSVSRFRVA